MSKKYRFSKVGSSQQEKREQQKVLTISVPQPDGVGAHVLEAVHTSFRFFHEKGKPMKNEEKAALLIAAQTGASSMLWGPPGQGKSKFVRSGFGKLGYVVKVLRVNTILPHHLGGSLAPDKNGEQTKTLPPDWAVELNRAEKSVLFLDDMSCASPSGQTAAMGLMDEREIGGLKLKAVTIGAANPNTLATARFDLDAAAANRALHITITSHGATFREDAMAGWPAPRVPVIRDNWEQLVEQKADLITKFLCTPDGETVLNAMPEQVTTKTVAWPSERSWEMCWRLLAACDALKPESMTGLSLVAVRSLLFAGSVGEGAYRKFNNHYLKPMEVSVTDAMRHGKAYSFPETGDEMFGLLGAVSAKLNSGSLSQKQWEQACSLLEGAWETSHRDRAVTFALDLISMNQGLYDFPQFFTKHIAPVLQTNV